MSEEGGTRESFIWRDCLNLSLPLPHPDVSDCMTESAWNDNNSKSSKGDNRPHVVLKSWRKQWIVVKLIAFLLNQSTQWWRTQAIMASITSVPGFHSCISKAQSKSIKIPVLLCSFCLGSHLVIQWLDHIFPLANWTPRGVYKLSEIGKNYAKETRVYSYKSSNIFTYRR